MSKLLQYFNKKHLRVLSLLILLDLIATLTWFIVFGVEEANPLLSEQIKESPVNFALIKIGLSFPGIYILNKYIKRTVAQSGIGILLFCYYGVALIHCFIFFALAF